MVKRQQFNINIPDSDQELISRFKDRCEAERASMSKTVLTLIRDYMEPKNSEVDSLARGIAALIVEVTYKGGAQQHESSASLPDFFFK